MSREATLEALRRGLITPEQAKARLAPVERQTTAGEAAVRNFAQGVTLGTVDEIASGLGAGYDALVKGANIGDAYNARLDANRAQDALTQKQRPVLSTATNIAGGATLAAGGAMAAPASRLLNPATAGQLAKSGATFGALQGFFSGQGTEGRVLDAGMGGALGAASGYATGRVLDKVLPKSVPTPDELKANYVQVKNSMRDVPIDGQRLIDEVAQPMTDQLRFVQGQYDPKVGAALENLRAVGQRNPNAFAVDEIRSRLPGDKDGMALKTAIDSFLEGQNVAPEFRDTYRRAIVAEKLEQAFDRGNSSPAAMRTMLDRIGRSKGLTAVEAEAIKAAAKAPSKVGNLPAAILSLAGGNPTMSMAAYGGARLADGLAEDVAQQRVMNAMNAVLTGQRMPSYAQRFGKLLGR